MRQSDAVLQLEALLDECRVYVEGDDKGSGFFVAPGWVVTCAHVARAEVGTTVTVGWNGSTCTGTVRAAAGTQGSPVWRPPDLAVVEVPGFGDHPCVWLDGTRPAQAGPLLAAGHTAVWGIDGLAPRTASFRAGARTTIAELPMVELTGGEVNHGLSGGPVLNLETWGVCAVVKASRNADSVMGGIATPVDALRLLDPEVYRTVIRAHDLYHGRDSRWSGLADVAVGADRARTVLPPTATCRILDQLAALGSVPRPDELQRAFAGAAPRLAPQPRYYPLRDPRDVFTELASLAEPEDRCLPYSLAFAADVLIGTQQAAPPGVARKLREAVVIAATYAGRESDVLERLETGPVEHGSSSSPSSILCRIRPLARDRRLFHVGVWYFRSTTDVAPAGESAPLPLAAAFDWLKDCLPHHIRVMGGATRPGLIELLLPVEAMDEAVEQWELWPDRFWALGGKQRVVLRALERHDDVDLLAGWQQRWEQLNRQRVDGALWCVCGRDRQEARALEAFIENHPERAAVVLAAPPRTRTASDAYWVAVESGVPVIVWRRDAPSRAGGSTPCGFPGEAACPGDPFFAEVCTALDGSERDQVPERVRWLRNEARATKDADHIGGRIAVIWDDPGRRLPDARLTPAEEGMPA